MIRIVHQLRLAKGRLKKEAILKQYNDSYYWKKALLYMYDDSINFYVSAPNDFTFIDGDLNYTEMFKILDMLKSGDYLGRVGQNLALQASKDFGEIFRLILNRSLNAGVSVTTINKVYDNYIPTFDVMLAKDVEIKRYPVLGCTKYDGVRLLAFCVGDKVVLKTRSGKDLNFVTLKNKMEHFPIGVYDGELVAGDGRTENRTGITGHVNRILKGTSTSMKDYTYVIFDYMTLDDWYSKNSTMPYVERHARLNEFYISDMNIRYIDIFELRTLDHVNEIFSDHIQRGFEGLILRYPEDPYMWTRSEKLIKKKAINEFVLKCTDVTEGTGKYEGMIGALICEGIVEGMEVRVKIGSGLSAFDVEQHPSTYIGKNIEGLYNTVVKSDNNQYYSLFLPRFKRIKGDYSI